LNWSARGIVALLQCANRKWRDPADRLRSFMLMGWAIGFVEASMCAAFCGGLLAGAWTMLGGASGTTVIVFMITFFFLHVSFCLLGLVDARSYLPLSIWMERRICREWEIEHRYRLDNDFFEAAGSLTGIHMGAKTDVSRLEIARIAYTVQFFLWALDPKVQRDLQARSMQLASVKPSYTPPVKRL
jgi:hypothetical protein